MQSVHEPVLLREVLEYLSPSLGSGLLFDGTLGGGGHSEALLRESPKAFLVGVDRDSLALELAKETLKNFADRQFLLQGSYDQVFEIAGDLPTSVPALSNRAPIQFNSILLDLGISSDQLDAPERGFSFKARGPLDMRMDQSAPKTAADILNSYSEHELRNMFLRGGTHRGYAIALSRAVIERRPFMQTSEFSRLCDEIASPQESHRKSGKFRDAATVPFQALRIEVNDEFGMLERFLARAGDVLAPGGRLGIISFHSTEDQKVTQAMRRWAQPTEGDARAPGPSFGKLLTRSAVIAESEEATRNPRSRSARLRVFERAGEAQ